MYTFDEACLGKNVDSAYELCFFCLHENEYLCEKFWLECKNEERANATILLLNSIEFFPITVEKTFSFFSLIAQTNAKFCSDVRKSS